MKTLVSAWSHGSPSIRGEAYLMSEPAIWNFKLPIRSYQLRKSLHTAEKILTTIDLQVNLLNTKGIYTFANPILVAKSKSFNRHQHIFLFCITASRSVFMNSNTSCRFSLWWNSSINSIIFGSFSGLSSLISLSARCHIHPSHLLPIPNFLYSNHFSCLQKKVHSNQESACSF